MSATIKTLYSNAMVHITYTFRLTFEPSSVSPQYQITLRS